MKSRLLAIAGLLGLLPLILTGCQSQIAPSMTPTEIVPRLATQNPSIRGAIVEIHTSNGQLNGLYVVGQKETDTTYDKAMAGITAQTVVLIKKNSIYETLTPSDLKVGQIVAILFTGPIGTSYPVQGRALEILIIR